MAAPIPTKRPPAKRGKSVAAARSSAERPRARGSSKVIKPLESSEEPPDPDLVAEALELPEIPAGLPDEVVAKAPPPVQGMTRKQLTDQYMPYVRSIAGTVWKTLSKDIEFDDLVSYGILGLFEAYDRFDAKFGASFMTFAYYRVRGAIYDGLRGMGWVSRTEYAKYRVEQRANAYLNHVHDREVAPIAGEGSRRKAQSDDEAVKELADVVSGLVTIYVTALDAMEGFQVKDDRSPPIDESLELLQNREIVKAAVEKLPDQERKLIEGYYYQELSLEEIGKTLGLSKSWTSRLHARAIDKLSRVLKTLVDEHWEDLDVKGSKAQKKVDPKGRSLAQPSGTDDR
ncbi:MAG: sigma-70 family RNA polymerase sigma factor [Deltaproteobacteria bacterium]|nr:sigma-70 family RNA polymerase sigma factor [Deltaproteobacteria bacterium]